MSDYQLNKLLNIMCGVGVVLFIASLAGIALHNCSGKNIHTVDGYEHGVVICIDGGAMITVNEGHYRDKEISQLLKLAERCDEDLER